MNYIEIVIPNAVGARAEEIVALLADEPYEGFEEKDNGLHAYISDVNFNEAVLKGVLQNYGLDYAITQIPKTNWNKSWEEHFDPVMIEGFCTVRADFHDIKVDTPYEIIITPKMSFGTGHHATTKLMMLQMKEMDFQGKTVYDFGTGTGILAILASKLGAATIAGVDHEEWAVENARENFARNSADHVRVELGSIEKLPQSPCDMMLANINRHVLLEYMGQIRSRLKNSGMVLMSGILLEDRSIIESAATSEGLQLVQARSSGDWLSLRFQVAG